MTAAGDFTPTLPPFLVEDAVRAALAEDLGRAGDITSNATIGRDATARALLSTREEGILSGMPLARTAFALLEPSVKFQAMAEDCDRIAAGQPVAEIAGNSRSILAAERVALNFLMRMSGIATHTARFQDKIAHTGAKICCTRKTIPGHRSFDKYAVRCGGGANHRFGLDDAVLIKDNHIAVCGSVALAIRRARAQLGHLVAVEVEVENLQQLAEALDEGPDAVLLDNMEPAALREAVAINKRHTRPVRLEASGNVGLETVKEIAETGVDFISTSKITMAAPTLDLGLDIVIGR